MNHQTAVILDCSHYRCYHPPPSLPPPSGSIGSKKAPASVIPRDSKTTRKATASDTFLITRPRTGLAGAARGEHAARARPAFASANNDTRRQTTKSTIPDGAKRVLILVHVTTESTRTCRNRPDMATSVASAAHRVTSVACVTGVTHHVAQGRAETVGVRLGPAVSRRDRHQFRLRRQKQEINHQREIGEQGTVCIYFGRGCV